MDAGEIEHSVLGMGGTVAVDEAVGTGPFERGRDGARGGRDGSADRRRREVVEGRKEGQGRGDAEFGAFGACEGGRAAGGPVVLVPVLGGERYEPGGTDAHNASGGGDGREVELRVRFVSARGGGMVDGVPA